MDYKLPDLPTGQRWRVAPSVVQGLTRLILEEKRWWGWKKIAYAVSSNEAFVDDTMWLGNYVLTKANTSITYGTKEGTL